MQACLDRKALRNDPNPCKDVNLSWDGTGFTALWTLLRANYRYQVFYGRALCD